MTEVTVASPSPQSQTSGAFVHGTAVTDEAVHRRAAALWAKTDRRGGDHWLPLHQHMADSLQTTQALWSGWLPRQARATICRLTGLSDDDAAALTTWMAATHDAGKATLSFQLQIGERPEHAAFRSRLEDAGLPLRMPRLEAGLERFPHGLASRVIVQRWLREHDVDPETARSLAAVHDAHHGRPSSPGLRRAAQRAVDSYPVAWREAQDFLLGECAAKSGIYDVLRRLDRPLFGPAQNLLTGIVIMADWIASCVDYFPLCPPGEQPTRRGDELDAVDLTAPWAPDAVTDADALLARRFPALAAHSPRDVQRTAVDCASAGTGAALLVIEAGTGEGKTEAALGAAEALAAVTGAGGAIFAAPTMATADGLFRRVLGWAQEATPTSEITSMFLAHSKSALNADFSILRHAGSSPAAPQGVGAEHGDVIASEWMSGRKKGLLSNFCVATIDQVLFAVLQGKHSMLRHVALAGKVVILDEVHSFDAYTNAYLLRTLEWLGRYGIPTVLLSATLTPELKRRLCGAYGGQLGQPTAASEAPVIDGAAPYPLVTHVDASGIAEYPARSEQPETRIRLGRLPDDLTALVSCLGEELADGGCALVICNTVSRAQDAFEVLAAAHPEQCELHHSAFAAVDRVKKEAELRELLGPHAHRDGKRPHTRIIVATQVAEQSLDIDVDLLVSDVAPMDILLQRIGRLHRHERPATDRPERLRAPRALLRGADWTASPPVFPRACEAVYGRAALLRSAAVIEAEGWETGVLRPAAVPRLTRLAYAPDLPAPPGWADAMHAADQDFEARNCAAERRSRSFMFPPPVGSESLDDQFTRQHAAIDSPGGAAQGAAQVRDTDPSIEVVLAIGDPSFYRPLPWLDGAGEAALVGDAEPPSRAAFALARSTVRLPLLFSRDPERFEQVVKHLETRTPSGWRESRLLRGELALFLDAELRGCVDGVPLAYSPVLGLHHDQRRNSPASTSAAATTAARDDTHSDSQPPPSITKAGP
ncbi:CRISPR-associated helicase Cas3' [Brevibacterium sp. BRM-1]|uniref:CRISPR-associated helicase Cas3' n=1 Tax=Brevibacterium sp. BRM-1 TaxID=2999062 RepID=UPI0022804C97|nr:CRISPR-associated helicase Cas3' [Brevibacterium sp. BRM-1]WAL39136.1 CRISPR-associated helicase Cas3' [Brevibacterium sp. BRM-1]